MIRILEPHDPASTYADVLDALPVIAYMARPDGLISYMSRGWSHATGNATRDAIGNSFINTVHPDQRARVSASWRDAVQRVMPYRDELLVQFADGRYHWMVNNADPIRDTDGTVLAWFGTLTDIDELHLAREAATQAQAQAHETTREADDRYRIFSDALPGIAWTATPTGQLSFLGDRWKATRDNPTDGLGDGWLESIHPHDRPLVETRWAAALLSGDPYEVEFRVRMRAGSYRWQLVRALAQRSADGTIVRWVGVNIDIDDRMRADQDREMFVAIAQTTADLVCIADDAGQVRFLNDAGRALLSIAPSDMPLDLIALIAHDSRASFRAEVLAVVERDGRFTGRVRFANRRTGISTFTDVNAIRLRTRSGESLGVGVIAHERREATRIEDGLRLLASTGEASVASLDIRSTFENIARACVEEFGSYCLIDIFHEEDRWERVAVHRDDEAAQELAALTRPEGDHPIARTYRTGFSGVEHIDDTWLADVTATDDRISAVTRLRIRSVVIAPVVAPDGALIGAITVGRDAFSDRENFIEADLPFVQEVGRRLGAAVTNARSYDQQRRIAVEFQSASLPRMLPQAASLKLDAYYRPGSDEATIGGDWYDAIMLADGRIAMTIGDVLGHGLHAAVLMTKLRQAMQSAALVDPDPSTMLAVADRTILLADDGAYATAIAALFDPKRRTLALACAGHPQPLRRRSDGRIESIACSGTMLGLGIEAPFRVDTVSLEPGDTLVFFTDGLTEVRRDWAAGNVALQAALDDVDVARPGAARWLVERALDGAQATDDIAVLIAALPE